VHLYVNPLCHNFHQHIYSYSCVIHNNLPVVCTILQLQKKNYWQYPKCSQSHYRPASKMQKLLVHNYYLCVQLLKPQNTAVPCLNFWSDCNQYHSTPQWHIHLNILSYLTDWQFIVLANMWHAYHQSLWQCLSVTASILQNLLERKVQLGSWLEL